MIEGGIKQNCVYTTMGGYVVEIVDTKHGYCVASLRTSPGENSVGDNASDMIPQGWSYDRQGRMDGLTDFWNKNLEIVAQICDLTKLDFNNLPPNIHLVDGYPMVKNMGEEFMPGHKSYDDYSSYDNYIKELRAANEQAKKEISEIKPPNPTVEFGKRTLTYWFFEPTKTMALQAAKSVRYALVLSILGSAGYGSFHPDQIKNFVLKCLPKVSVQAPEIMK